jgi:ABC-2 type transport system ATP-binding protein
MSALLELGAGFHPDLSGRDNVFLNASILGMSRPEIARRFDEIVDFSGLEQFIDTPVKAYSSGMYVRLAFAVAINVDPEMLLIDEILAVGDIAFQQKCMEKFVQFRDEGRTLVLVTHDMGSIRNFCDRAIWLDHGVVAGEGAPSELVDLYTESMLSEDDPAPVAEGARRGSGEIKVDRVEMIVDGRQAFRVRTGDTVTFRLHYSASEPVPTPVFAVELARLGAATVTAPSTRDGDLVPDVVDGSGVLDVTMEHVALLPGPHVLHTEITDFGRQHSYDHVHTALRFDVIAGDSHEVNGVVTMRPRWNLDQRA